MPIENATTRGRIVTLLRSGAKTVDELATELEVTDNAVRAHLNALIVEGLVGESGSRRGAGAGKPPRLYELTVEADERLSRAFRPLLEALLEAAADHLSPAETERLLEEAGARLAREHPLPAGQKDRVAHALQVVRQMGGAVTVQRQGTGALIASPGCALGPISVWHPEACRVMRAMLAELIGRPVTEHCEHSPRAKCRFEVQMGGRIDG